MDNKAFLTAYNESRNGCNAFYSHWLVRRFHYTDGVKACADAGCAWLIDVAATELVKVLRDTKTSSALLEVHVKDYKGHLAFTNSDSGPPLWHREMDLIDMPDGVWVFELCDEVERVAMILVSEH